MSKQPAVLFYSPEDGINSDSGKQRVSGKSPCADPLPCSSSPTPHDAVQTETAGPKATDESENKSVSSDNVGAFDKEACKDNSDVGIASGEGQPQQAMVEYEYMDIRKNSMSEKAQCSLHQPREDGIYQNTPELSAPIRRNRRSRKVDEDEAIAEQLDEYEEMNTGKKVGTSAVRLEYQNFPAKGRMVSGEEPHRVKMRAFGGACAGVDEKDNGTSFDNPDYWHSRLFHKPDAVCM